jgi:hypothetical protein
MEGWKTACRFSCLLTAVCCSLATPQSILLILQPASPHCSVEGSAVFAASNLKTEITRTRWDGSTDVLESLDASQPSLAHIFIQLAQ